jgi:hypothetical protein
MKIQKSMICLCILCVAGCVPSLHQLYTDKTLVYEPAIVGTWQHDEERWEFVGDPNDRSYELTIFEKEDKQSKLKTHFVEFSGQRFFDFYPSDDAELEGGEWLKFHVIGVHLFFKVQLRDSKLMAAAMNPDTVEKLLKEKPGLVEHEVLEEDGRIVLTDAPENLQKFLLEGVKIKDFFGDFEVLERVEE